MIFYGVKEIAKYKTAKTNIFEVELTLQTKGWILNSLEDSWIKLKSVN